MSLTFVLFYKDPTMAIFKSMKLFFNHLLPKEKSEIETKKWCPIILNCAVTYAVKLT